MKKMKYESVTVGIHHRECNIVGVTGNDFGDSMQSVAEQVISHRDLHWAKEVDGETMHHAVPDQSVAWALFTYAAEEVEAPHDDICDGYCDKKGLNIELKDISSKCYTLDGANLASMSFVVGGETITVTALDGDVSGLIKAKTYDCEAVDAEIAYEMALSEGTATLTITATHNGETVTKAISTETECA